MKKSLSQFKKDIQTGMHIEYIQNMERAFDSVKHTHMGEWYRTELPERIQGVRYVSYKDTTGFYLKKSADTSERGSFCGWPKANELAYFDDTFTIIDYANNGEPYQMRTYKIITIN